ncbi:MAG: response regulator transcription factor [Bacteroidetes bacterium]|nr:MAG: response regulator transcription factor [Bacteroidota bacterium]
MNTKNKVLVIEDSEDFLTPLRTFLMLNDYDVLTAETGKEALDKIMEEPDAIILDLGLPDMEGIDVLKEIKRITEIPVLVLSARDSKNDFESAFSNGADDYITKSNLKEELIVVKLNNLIGRNKQTGSNALFGNGKLYIDFRTKVVRVNDTKVHLTEREYELLELFAQNAGKLLENESIFRKIWGDTYS